MKKLANLELQVEGSHCIAQNYHSQWNLDLVMFNKFTDIANMLANVIVTK